MRFFHIVLLLSAYCTCIFSRFEDTRKFFRIGGVVSNGRECAPIGQDVLKNGGNAIDAAIAVLLCEGVTGPQSMGIGGGFLATIYIKNQSLITTINAREAAPRNVSEKMFIVDGKVVPIVGGHASAIPSEIKGYWELKQRYGNPNIKWEQLFEPTIKLCKEGYIVDRFLATVLEKYKEKVSAEPTLSEIFVNPQTKEVYKEGETAFRPQLGKTLRKIAENGAEEFYGGATGQDFIDDVRAMGGILTMEDLKDYKVKERDPVGGLLDKHLTLYTVPLPGSGVVLNEIVQLLQYRVHGGISYSTFIHRMAEAMKHSYGLRSKLADSDFEPSAHRAIIEAGDFHYQSNLRKKIANDDNSTHNDTTYYGGVYGLKDHDAASNIAVIDEEGNGITVTSTVNNFFGAFVRSRKTGIILNDAMDGFSTPGVTNAYGYPPSPNNFIKPGKRPMSSMCPTIILTNDRNIRLLIGGTGGSQSTTSVAQAIIRHIFLPERMERAINILRIHHQLIPNKLMYEEGHMSKSVFNKLLTKGHVLEPHFMVNISGFSAVTAIVVISTERQNGSFTQNVFPMYDLRRGGSAAITDGRLSVFPDVS